MRPATASLVIGGSAWWPSSSRLESRKSQPQLARVAQVLGDVVAEDLERAFDAGAGGDGGLGGAAQVGVVEVDQAVRGRAHLAALAQLLPAVDGCARRP